MLVLRVNPVPGTTLPPVTMGRVLCHIYFLLWATSSTTTDCNTVTTRRDNEHYRNEDASTSWFYPGVEDLTVKYSSIVTNYLQVVPSSLRGVEGILYGDWSVSGWAPVILIGSGDVRRP